MAEIKLTLPDTHEKKVIDAFCALYGYEAKMEDGSDNPVTKRQFVKQQLTGHIKTVVSQWEAQEAEKARPVSEINIT